MHEKHIYIIFIKIKSIPFVCNNVPKKYNIRLLMCALIFLVKAVGS